MTMLTFTQSILREWHTHSVITIETLQKRAVAEQLDTAIGLDIERHRLDVTDGTNTVTFWGVTRDDMAEAIANGKPGGTLSDDAPDGLIAISSVCYALAAHFGEHTSAAGGRGFAANENITLACRGLGWQPATTDA